MLQAVHAQAGRNHENQYGKYRGEELLPFAVQYFCNQPEGIIVGIDPEQPEYPHDSQHPESYRSGREEDRQIIGEKGKHVHDSGKGQNIFPDSLFPDYRIPDGRILPSISGAGSPGGGVRYW